MAKPKAGVVLIVDDDADFRALLAALLPENVAALEAGRLRDADVLLSKQNVDVIVADGLLPDGNGAAWVARLREGGDQRPMIFASALFKDNATAATMQRLKIAQLDKRQTNPAEIERVLLKTLAAAGIARPG